MTPLEINQAIATVKIAQEPMMDPDQCSTEDFVANRNQILITFNSKHGHKNWAESIADAWELFEEMVYYYGGLISVLLEGNSMPMSGWPKYKIVFDENDAHVRNKEFSGASTAPLAICLAWLEWKRYESRAR